MARTKFRDMGDTAAGQAVRAFAEAATALARLRDDIPDREVLDNIDMAGRTRGDGLVVLREVREILVRSERVFAHYDDVMLTDRANKKFRLLSVDGRAEPKAGARLSDIVACVQIKKDKKTGEETCWEFKLPDSICDQFFASSGCTSSLPAVKTYATHSVFDGDFLLHGPGYHPEQQILVQGVGITPDMSSLPAAPRRPAATVKEATDRLPPHLHRLLKDFDWAGVIDLINAIGALLMGLLMNHFVEDGHPMVVIRGNQPSIGKSLLAKVIGMIFDGRLVAAIKKSGDEEFDKLLCGLLKKRRRMIFLDNLRSKLDSERIEQIVTSPTIMVRILGVNDFGEWPNDVLFILTSNGLVAGRDLVSRNLTIDLYTEGDPKKRQAARKASRPLRYAHENRAGILGELAAMVMRWVDAGLPDGELNTRFDKVSQIIGGILDVNGFPGFASNAEAAALEMDDDLLRMLGLAEVLVAGKLGPDAIVRPGDDSEKAGRVAGDWIRVFEELKLIDLRGHEDATDRMKSVMVGKVFSRYIDMPLEVEVGGRPHIVRIRKRDGRSGNKKFYYGEVTPIVVEAGAVPADPVASLPVSAGESAAPPADIGDGLVPSTKPTGTPRKSWFEAAGSRSKAAAVDGPDVGPAESEG
jgi:hypothetical protein